jgi:hypothetical protein
MGREPMPAASRYLHGSGGKNNSKEKVTEQRDQIEIKKPGIRPGIQQTTSLLLSTALPVLLFF